jgi:hypothetical protein
MVRGCGLAMGEASSRESCAGGGGRSRLALGEAGSRGAGSWRMPMRLGRAARALDAAWGFAVGPRLGFAGGFGAAIRARGASWLFYAKRAFVNTLDSMVAGGSDN